MNLFYLNRCKISNKNYYSSKYNFPTKTRNFNTIILNN